MPPIMREDTNHMYAYFRDNITGCWVLLPAA